jgi:hypothetical protein
MKPTARVFTVCLAIALCTSLSLAAAEQPTCLVKQLETRSTQLTQPIDFTALSQPAAPISPATPILPQLERSMVGYCSLNCARCNLGTIPDSCQARGLGTCNQDCA